MTEHTSLDPGNLAAPPRERLLRFARLMGGGPDSEEVVQEALQAVGGPDHPDPQHLWWLLANRLADRAADRHRQVARAQILVRHRVLMPDRPPPRADLAGRAEPSRTARQLVALLPRDILDLLWNHHIGGLSWAELATTRQVPPDALQRQVHLALHAARRQIARS